ncbi:major facilitator superfamily MFS_1 [Beutenbergia cavernae DSM 12333]|uniref:Major facilitator superfamily MFS_1 n=1 Tax=Beutenbergia cavernae (strain ATCC BAA-8 / DSM 12333 / CCUG 43141 / JCM 11478 / NBRC 16432 / NCIMB 13614 / HKI 0122) TaxID=471853 RepID=C5BX78_BEUC1|nr:MFS transporter [Beutenbergia cavernae]ACQ78753.1 major facilitator superfamily MFS_1 [Beutenbergia cavernae DSM 12333]
MTTPSTTPSRLPYHALIWLAVAAFSTGIDGYVLAGLLPAIAGDLQVSDSWAGQLVSVFALTSALAGPILGAATGGWERRRTIAASLAVFVAGNLAVALAPNYPAALGGRVLSALGASLLNAVITSYVIHLAPEQHRGRALSFVLGGWMAATALGVPVGLLLGQSSWRFPLVMVAVVGAVALVGIALRLPRLTLPATTLRERLRPLGRPQLVGGLLVTTGILCASYTCFTYAVLILGPTHPESWMIIAIMFGYGLASLLGNAFTGRLADRFTPARVLTVILVGLLLNSVLGAVSFAVTSLSVTAVLGLVWFFVAGVGNGGAAVPQQARLAAMAPESATMVMALNASAISLGSALGGGLGGLTLAGGLEPPGLLVVAAVVLAATLALHLAVATLTARRRRLA